MCTPKELRPVVVPLMRMQFLLLDIVVHRRIALVASGLLWCALIFIEKKIVLAPPSSAAKPCRHVAIFMRDPFGIQHVIYSALTVLTVGEVTICVRIKCKVKGIKVTIYTEISII